MNKPRVVVSRCLLGHPVRYNGQLKQAPFPEEYLEKFHLLPICPEVLAGMSVPRPAINLTLTDRRVEAVTVENEHVTDALEEAVERFVASCGAVHGGILKARSPSCGIGDVPLHAATGLIDTSIETIGAVTDSLTDGIAAKELAIRFPKAYFCNEEFLSTDAGRERFLEAVYSLIR